MEIANQKVNTQNILYLEGEGSYTKIIFITGKRLLCSIPLSKLLEKLHSDAFLRTHKSYAVNIVYVLNYNYTQVILSNNTRVALSRSHTDAFKKRYYAYLSGN